MKLLLRRLYKSDVQTRGTLEVRNGDEQVLKCKTLELPWRENKNRVSCIPAGTYPVEYREAVESGSFGYDHFHVRDVEGRSYILIHRGNLYTQILGCILVGRKFVDINGDGHPDVTHSGPTLSRLRDVLSGPLQSEGSVPLEIQDGYEGRFETEIAVPDTEPEWDGLVAGLDEKAVEIDEHIPDEIDPTP
ncbi:DUF5675 family protein [Salinibacter ruber]|uniref:DUF5675 domain-containing protein n=1 Tax=Salinibacter ruber TaxID=146919 RepID=A0AAW5P8E9_9BACT|nr:DUF5675 family protein [Salinibacter ruber]MCS4157759.1 hypothetical protein [Salinibacter ruber]